MRGWCEDGDGFCGDDAGTGTGFWKLRGWEWGRGSVLRGRGGDGVDEICAVRGWGRTLDPVSFSSAGIAYCSDVKQRSRCLFNVVSVFKQSVDLLLTAIKLRLLPESFSQHRSVCKQ